MGFEAGDGIVYGSGNIQDTDLDAFVDIPRNAAALFAINSNPASGFGGKPTTLDPTELVVEKVFANTKTSNPADGNSVLILAGPKIPDVPVPGAVWLFGSTLLGILAVARRGG